MKTSILTCLCLAAFTLVSAQTTTQTCIPLIGDNAPKFTAQSTEGEIKFPENYFGKWKILLSHPADFTPVCSSEMIELAKLSKDFAELNTQLIVISTDGINSHMEWIRAMEDIKFEDGSSVKIDFPIISDVGLEVSKKYGMIQPNFSSTKDIRAVFFIDPEDKIRALFYYPATTGRNYWEIKRTLIAMQTADKNYVLTPANWNPGDDAMIPNPATKAESEKMLEKDKKDENIYSRSWFMWYKKLEK